ncbi:MAG: hypothetical protein AAB512_04250 [Patescibacteria group bacterium]
MKKLLFIVFISLATFILVVLSVKGQFGHPVYFQSEKDTRVGGPFESSNSNSRYALTEAIVERGTLFLDDSLAKFSAPDIVHHNGKYFSIFTPGVSFVGVPFYALGKIFGMPQLFSYSMNALFGLINMFLVVWLARKFGASFYASLISGFLFLFATNSLAYALTFTQHQLSTTLILLALINAIGKRTFINNMLIGLIFSAGLLVDIPNVLMMTPIMIYVFVKHFQSNPEQNKSANFPLRLIVLSGIIIGIVPLFALFGWYNYQTTSSYTKIGQFIGRANYPADELEVPTPKNPNRILLPYDTRKQLNGLYILLLSNERGWLFYSPVILVGIIGLYIAYQDQQKRRLAVLSTSVVLITIISYSMFGDPWGGWSFGPRYLIPAAAILSSAIGVAVAKYKNNILFVSIFILLAAYSLAISSVGALTTSAIPPRVEAVNLANPIAYTYEYNFQFINNNLTSSLIYNLYLSQISVKTFLFVFYIVSILAFIVILVFELANKKKDDQ